MKKPHDPAGWAPQAAKQTRPPSENGRYTTGNNFKSLTTEARVLPRPSLPVRIGFIPESLHPTIRHRQHPSPSHAHVDDPALFGVHALACWQAADTLKGGHQTPPAWQNENCCPSPPLASPLFRTIIRVIRNPRFNPLWCPMKPTPMGSRLLPPLKSSICNFQSPICISHPNTHLQTADGTAK